MKRFERMRLLPILLCVTILPFVVKGVLVESSLADYDWAPDTLTSRMDFFLYEKSRWLCLIAIVMLFLLFDYFVIQGGLGKENRQGKLKGSKWSLILLAAYGGLAFLSTLRSVDAFASQNGMVEQFESIWVLMSYLVVALYSFFMIREKNDVSFIFKGMCIFLGVQCVIGLPQMFGFDLFQTEIGKKILLQRKYSYISDQLIYSLGNDLYRKVYTTFYHANYAAVYFAMLLPIVLSLCCISKSKKSKLALIILTIGDFLCLIGTGSRAGLVAVVLTGIFVCGIVIYINRANLDKKMYTKYIAIIALVGIAIAVLAGSLGAGNLFARDSKELSAYKNNKLENLSPQADAIHMIFDQKKYAFGYEKAGTALEFFIKDEKGNELPVISDEQTQTCQVEAQELSDIVFQCYERNGISYVLMEYQDITWRFTKDTPTGEYGYINIFGKLSQIENAKSVGFANKLNLFSGRGYIWSRTLPLLRQHIFIGSGPDTFITQFPQNDYVAKASLGKEFFTQMITRAHSMYLQMGVQTGVLSALCFVLAVGIYIFVSINLFLENKNDVAKTAVKGVKKHLGIEEITKQEEVFRLGVLSSILIYLIMGITNDSMIVTAPIFWTLLGVGMSLNHIKMHNTIA